MKLLPSLSAGVLALAAFDTYATESLGDVTATNGFALSSDTLSGSFSDTYTFSLGGASEAADSWTNSWTSLAGSIGDFTVTLTGPNGFSDTETATTVGNSQIVSSYYSLLAAGDYTLTISGTAASNATYAGSFSVSAVPEPGSLALMLGGLGVLAFVARRRKR